MYHIPYCDNVPIESPHTDTDGAPNSLIFDLSLSVLLLCESFPRVYITGSVSINPHKMECGCKSRTPVPPQNSGHGAVVEGKAILTQFSHLLLPSGCLWMQIYTKYQRQLKESDVRCVVMLYLKKNKLKFILSNSRILFVSASASPLSASSLPIVLQTVKQ